MDLQASFCHGSGNGGLRLQPVGLSEDIDFCKMAVSILWRGTREEGVVGGAELREVSGWLLENDDIFKRQRRGEAEQQKGEKEVGG